MNDNLKILLPTWVLGEWHKMWVCCSLCSGVMVLSLDWTDARVCGFCVYARKTSLITWLIRCTCVWVLCVRMGNSSLVPKLTRCGVRVCVGSSSLVGLYYIPRESWIIFLGLSIFSLWYIWYFLEYCDIGDTGMGNGGSIQIPCICMNLRWS